MKTIAWIGFDDGWGIVGYGFVCPECDSYNTFANTMDDTVTCEECNTEFINPGDPDKQ